MGAGAALNLEPLSERLRRRVSSAQAAVDLLHPTVGTPQAHRGAAAKGRDRGAILIVEARGTVIELQVTDPARGRAATDAARLLEHGHAQPRLGKIPSG